MKKNIVAAAVAALVLPTAAFADNGLSYTFGEVSYIDFGDAGDGLGLEGSYKFHEMLFGFAEYQGIDDSDTLAFGIGAATALNETVDGFAKLAFVSNDSGSADDTGIGLEFGVRAMIVKQVEAFGSFTYVDIYEDSQTGFEVGGRYWLQDNLGVSLSYSDIEDSDGITLAARYNF